MPIKIIVVGDTHVLAFKKISLEIVTAMRNADYVVHVGDYTSKNVLDGLLKLKDQRFKGVYGNADPLDIQNELTSTEIFEILGKRIGITHPAVGGSDKLTRKRVLSEFKEFNVDAILYGHTHVPLLEFQGDILLVNPGKGYFESHHYGSPTSIVELYIGKDIRGKIVYINS